MLFIYSQSHGTALTESQNRPEKKPHAEPKDEDHAEKICDEDEHFVNVEKPSDKPSILVVMHHTFNSDHVVAGSRRLVTKPNVLLTVDCLFYEGHFLKCERNNAAWDEVKKKLEVYDNQKKVTLKASQTLFYIFLAGKTNGAHRDFVKKLEAVGHTETSSPEGCDYIVRFCPVASRVGTDVNAALNKIPDPAASETVKLAVSCRVAGSRWVIRPVLCGDVNGSAAGCGGGSRRAGAGESSRWSARTRVYRGLQVERTRAGENKEQKEQGASLWSRQLFISVFVVTPVLLFGPIMMADFQVPPLFVACISGSSDVSAGEPVSWNMSDQLVGNKEPPVCVKNDAGNKNCAIRPSVGKDCSEAQNKMPVLGNKFAVILAGKTNKAHRDFVKKLEAVGQTEVSSPEGCDYVVCFCPVASRVGTDVSEALDRIPADKPFILVVMHHTFSPDHVVAESRRLVNNSHVLLTVDCLFYEGQFLKCERNNAAWDKVKKKFIQMRKISFTKMSSHNTFFVLQLNGRGERKAHCDFVNKLKNVGLNEVSCPEESHHLVIFCYVTSGDIIHAVNTLAVYQPTILVLMYHTSSPDRVVAESRRLLTGTDFKLTVDCLYNEDKILECKHNDEVWDEVKKYLGVSDFKVSMFRDL
ncbi:uncharacterized protein LOC114849476 isoform X6 [Betta splendens]|uniref:Uncharacterized protein LOC114849476 isoform X6 n=1 Tax=Betta splendens TaxID=158456 RepID=A0A9W2XLA4_BETSP|nr:uncharacterized protein LOC114849476 isoform X6 [Betta splendens]